MARLGDVCDILNGFAFKSEQYVDVGIRIIRIANVQKGYIEDSVPVFYPCDSRDAKKYILEEGDLLMSLTGNVGRVAKLSKEFLPAALNQRVACLRIKDGIPLDKAFLFNMLNSDYFEQQCIAASKGVAQKNMSTEWLKEYEIPMFSLEQQKLIAAVLDKASELIALRKAQLAKLDQLVKSRFIELFDSIDNCKISKFCDECEEITAGGDRPKDTSEIRTEDYPYPVFANAATNEGLLCFSREYKIEKPCVTIAARGCTVGFTAIRYEKFTPIVRLISLVPKETVTPIYLKHYIDIKMNIEGNGAAQPQLTIPMIKNMEIMVPPIELQNQFAAFVEQTDKSKLAIQQSLDKLELLKKSLMQEYFG